MGYLYVPPLQVLGLSYDTDNCYIGNIWWLYIIYKKV